MCIVIDTNTLGHVFDSMNANHNEFKPVFDWIHDGKGKIVFGGTRYLQELGKYLPLFNVYKAAGKAVSPNIALVDEEEKAVAAKIQDPDFDDPHIVGLLRVSGCKLICSWDSRAYPYFTHSDFFSPAYKKPKIYSGKRNRDLLTDQNIADICAPCLQTTKAQKAIIKP